MLLIDKDSLKEKFARCTKSHEKVDSAELFLKESTSVGLNYYEC